MASSSRYSGELNDSYEINVITASEKVTRVTVRDSDTISQVERKIHGKKKPGPGPSTLINIFIENLQGRITYYLEVDPSDTIGNVKAKMGDFAHVLVHNGAVLEDSSTLADLYIVNGSAFTRIDTALLVKFEIFVHTFTKKTISLLVTPTDTIANVKLCIMYKERVPVDEQVLIFNGMALGDCGTLSNFDIHDKSTLTLVRRSRGSMKIFVKPFKGKVIAVKVNPSTTISSIKSKIEGEVDIPQDEQELIFDETVLDNIDSVADCNINDESTLTLVRMSTHYMSMYLFIKTLGGPTITMIVKPSDTIYNVKSKLEKIEGTSADKVNFIFRGWLLKDDHTLAEYNIHDESTIKQTILLKGD